MEKLDFDINKVSLAEIDKVRPNNWNPKEKGTDEYETVKRGIELNGLKQPVRVRENEGFEIIDGEQRWRACKELGYTHVIIYNEGVVADKLAKEMTAWWQHQVPFAEVDLAQFIKKLADEFGEVNLPFTPEQIENYKNMTEFDFEKIKEDTDVLDNKDIEMAIYKVTIEQKDIIDKAIAKVKEEAENAELSDGKCLELICGDYLAK